MIEEDYEEVLTVLQLPELESNFSKAVFDGQLNLEIDEFASSATLSFPNNFQFQGSFELNIGTKIIMKESSEDMGIKKVNYVGNTMTCLPMKLVRIDMEEQTSSKSESEIIIHEDEAKSMDIAIEKFHEG
jgi:hypothetical protein